MNDSFIEEEKKFNEYIQKLYQKKIHLSLALFMEYKKINIYATIKIVNIQFILFKELVYWIFPLLLLIHLLLRLILLEKLLNTINMGNIIIMKKIFFALNVEEIE